MMAKSQAPRKPRRIPSPSPSPSPSPPPPAVPRSCRRRRCSTGELLRSPQPGRRNLRPRKSERPLVVGDFYHYSSPSSSESASASEDEDEENEASRRRNLKLVLRISQPSGPAVARRRRRLARESSESESESSEASSNIEKADEESDRNSDDEEEDVEHSKPPKKRRLRKRLASARSSFHESSDDGEVGVAAAVRSRRRAVSSATKVEDAGMPMPEQSSLEEILDKLQKKDTYGVFAEPVDPEELPDYHDVIEHPMDFCTMRRKLAKNAYRCFEQFEDDVFLICSNAMQYNAPDTVYFRQAHSIQELARKKFQKLREESLSRNIQIVDDHVATFDSISKDLLEPVKPFSRNGPEAINSDTSSGATHAYAGDSCRKSSTCAATTKPCTETVNINEPYIEHENINEPQREDANVCEPSVAAKGSTDSFVADVFVINGFPEEAKSENEDEFSARNSPSSQLCGPNLVDENRRFTYKMYPEANSCESDQILGVSDDAQLVAVGVDDEYSYARSLARFAASLGTKAWQIASKRIKKALPDDVKFGRGWVGEYEALPVNFPAVVSNRSLDHQAGRLNEHSVAPPSLQACKKPVSGVGFHSHRLPKSDSLTANLKTAGKSKCKLPAKPQSQFGTAYTNRAAHLHEIDDYETKPIISAVTNGTQKGKGDNQSREECEPTARVARSRIINREAVKSCHSSSLDIVPNAAMMTKSTECNRFPAPSADACKVKEAISSNNMKVQPKPFLHQPERVAASSNDATWVYHGRSNEDKLFRKPDKCIPSTDAGFISKSQTRGVAVPTLNNSERWSDSKKLAGSTVEVASSGNLRSGVESCKTFFPSFPSVCRDNQPPVATPAQAWISFGASSDSTASVMKPNIVKNSVWTVPPANMGTRGSSGSADSHFMRPPANVPYRENPAENGLVIFPRLFPTGFPRPVGNSQAFSGPQWQGLVPHNEQKPIKELFRPDLNIGFPSPGSPARHSSSISVEAQQPDLALQL